MSDEAKTPRPRRTQTLATALLSLWSPGLGHVYLGAWRRALVIAASILLALAAIGWLFTSPARPRLTIGLGLGIYACLLAAATLDAVRTARRTGGPTADARRRWLLCVLFYLGLTGLGALEATAIRAFWAQAFRVPTGSMEPTLLVGDCFFVDKRAYRRREPRRGEVVVFRHPRDPRQTYVERLVGLPGDSVEVRDNVLTVNGVRFTSDLLPGAEAQPSNVRGPVRRETLGGQAYLVLDIPTRPRRDLPAVRVPEGLYLVLGDNRNNSADSRFWGGVTRDALIGPVTHVYYSHDQETGRIRWRRVGLRLAIPD